MVFADDKAALQLRRNFAEEISLIAQLFTPVTNMLVYRLFDQGYCMF
jgi:hypothetical protein